MAGTALAEWSRGVSGVASTTGAETVSDRFEDERGVIQDVLSNIDSVTRITTVEGAVRGNHVHAATTQWTLVLSGCLLMATERGGTVEHTFMEPGSMVVHHPGEAHAWRAERDAECLVFTRGPRSGDQYESDTKRLSVPLL
jgi:quercetin dioxygenase-like cupin family protein